MSRGGMCREPFAGFARPDKLEPQRLLSPDDPPEKGIILATVLDAFQSYAYGCIGDMAPDGAPRGNGTTLENFWADVNYLFYVRADKRETWEDARIMRDVYTDDETGERVVRELELTDAQLQAMCFDRHFALLQWPRYFTMEAFLEMALEHRRQVLARSGDQIRSYLRLLRECAVYEAAAGLPLPLFIEHPAVDPRILLKPESPDEVASLVAVDPTLFTARTRPVHRPFRAIYRPETVEAVLTLTAADTGEGTLFAVPDPSVSSIPPVSDPLDDPRGRHCRLSA